MILTAGLCHKEQIIALWNDAFGDRREDVEKYLETILEYFLVYEDDGIVKGMLSVLPVSFCGKNGGYIYAVATDKKYRGLGICNKLMEHVKANNVYDFLVLKPQNEGLFDFYGKMGFYKVPQLKKKEMRVTKGKKNYQLKKISAKEYETARNRYFDDNIIKWDSAMLSFAKEMYNGDFYAAYENGKSIGFAFLYNEKDVAVIKELLAEEHDAVASFIADELNCSNVKFTFKNQNGNESFMIYPKVEESGYFNIYLD